MNDKLIDIYVLVTTAYSIPVALGLEIYPHLPMASEKAASKEFPLDNLCILYILNLINIKYMNVS